MPSYPREHDANAIRHLSAAKARLSRADETFIGGKAKNRAYAKKEPKKHAVMTLVERDGESRSFHVANVKAKTLREKIVTTVSRKSHLMTDELASYEKVGKEFANHGTVNHSANEYARLGGFAHINTAECRFSLMKRAVFGTHHSISEAHLPRYLSEWDYKWNTRKMTDSGTCGFAVKGAEGKRLRIDSLVKPRTLKQKARSFMRWRNKYGF